MGKITNKLFSIKNNVEINYKIYTVITIFGIKIKKLNLLKTLLFLSNKNSIDLSNIVQRHISTVLLHQKVFPKYKNINRGKDVVLIATGPTLKNFIPISDAIYVGVNKAFKYDKVSFNYLFLQDYANSTKTYIEDFCKYDAKKFLGLGVDYIQDAVPSIIPEKYSEYPNVERYHMTYPTEKDNFTFDISTQALGDFYSVVFPAMQFILWTNPKRIYLVGCDTNLSGYYDSKDKNNLAVNKIINGWKKMKEFTKTYYPDTEIISINPIGLKGIFKDEFTI